MSETAGNSWTYAKAGVDIDAGNELVRRIKPLVKSTRRTGADADIADILPADSIVFITFIYRYLSG